MLYGPLRFKGHVAKIDPDDGEITVIADGFAILAVVNFEAKGSLWVADTLQGALDQVNPETGETHVAPTGKAAVPSNLKLFVDGQTLFSRVNPSDWSLNTVPEGLALTEGLPLKQRASSTFLLVVTTQSTRFRLNNWRRNVPPAVLWRSC